MNRAQHLQRFDLGQVPQLVLEAALLNRHLGIGL